MHSFDDMVFKKKKDYTAHQKHKVLSIMCLNKTKKLINMFVFSLLILKFVYEVFSFDRVDTISF